MKRMLIAVALIAALAMPAVAETVYYGTMMVDHCEEWVSLRDGPGTGCGRLAKVPLYALVTDAQWTPLCGDFIHCAYDGQYGFILAKYLEPWADPEPDPNARFESALGFSFDYDAGLMTVDADSSEDGLGLILYPWQSDLPVYLEIMTGRSPEEFLAENAPADAEYEAYVSDGGAEIRWFRRSDGDVVRVFYAIEAGTGSAVACGVCPSEGAQSWIAQFNAVVFSLSFGPGAPVRVDWAEETDNLLVVDPDGEYVTIVADEPVADVALLALELSDSGELFEAAALCGRDAIGPDDPLVVKIAFPGDIPRYGIRFTDGEGQTRRFAIALSGRDGSLMLEEF